MTTKDEVNETASMLPQSSSPFFTMLHPEIRDAIYRLALTIRPHEDTIGYYRYAREPCLALFKDGVKGPLPGILFACKRMYQELPRDLLTGFSICMTKRPAGDPVLVVPWRPWNPSQLETRGPEDKILGVGAYGDMPLAKRPILTILIDGKPYGKDYGRLPIYGVMNVFSCVVFPEQAKKWAWFVGFQKVECAQMYNWDKSGCFEARSGRFTEVASGVKTLVMEWPPAGAYKRKEEPSKNHRGSIADDEYLWYFRKLKKQQENFGVESPLERVVLKGGYERSWADEVKEILEVEVVCE